MSPEREAALIEVRNERTLAVLAAPDAWASADLPGWVRERFPGIDLRTPETLPEPTRCAEGRPWGADPWGSVWGSLDDRWRAYVERRCARPCRNPWRDRATLLCGTHLAAWQRTRDDAAARLAKERRWGEATELARELGRLGVVAEAGAAGVVLRPADARALIGLLGADRDALLDLLGAVDLAVRNVPRTELRSTVIAAAADRARRHLDRTTPAPSATDTTGA